MTPTHFSFPPGTMANPRLERERTLPGVAVLEPVYSPDQPTRFLCRQVNAVLAQLLGKTPDALIGYAWREAFLVLSETVFYTHLVGVERTGVAYQQDLQIPGADRGFCLRIEQLGQQLLVIVYPLPAPLAVDQPLPLGDDERFHSLVDQLAVIVFQTDSKGRWTYLNPAWETVTGFPVEESLGHFFLDSIMPADRARCEALFASIQGGNRNLSKPIIKYLHQSEGYCWLEVQARVLVNDQQGFIGTSGILTDITQQKRAEDALRESEQRFRELAENVDELFWIRDVSAGRISYLNPVFETFTGIPVEEVYRDPMLFYSAVIPEDQPLIAAALQSQDVSATYQIRIRHRTGRLRWLTVRTFSIFDETGQLTRRIGVATDTTALIEKGQILEESLRKERSLTALQSQFITTASHEFRTPLTAISSSVELLLHYLGQLPIHPVLPAMARHITAIFTKVQSLDTLIGDTLTISKLEEGQIKVSGQELELVAFCQNLLQTTFAERPDHRRAELLVEGVAKKGRTDPKLLSHILVNLVSNAFKFSIHNPSVTIRFAEAQVELAVSDRGIGIPADELSKVFNKFFRARNAGDYQGTGLGLVICHDYALLLGGKLTVSSEQGIGTCFTLSLPFQNASLSGGLESEKEGAV